jgi:uncharacterized protein (TIGR04206 family)
VIASIFIVEDWRLVAASLAILAFVVILVSVVIIVAFIRNMTRPIGQLSLFDVAFVTWVYRRWERLKAHRSTTGTVARK